MHIFWRKAQHLYSKAFLRHVTLWHQAAEFGEVVQPQLTVQQLCTTNDLSLGYKEPHVDR